MAVKNYIEVTIDGRNYRLGGYEDEEYLQRIATYINSKWNAMREIQGFSRMPVDYQNVMLNLNLVDDFFQQKRKAEALEERFEAMEKQIYDLKHELVANQIQREKENNAE